MSKELEAYDIVFNSFNNCTCQDGRFPVRSALDTIYQALKRNEPIKPKLVWKNEEDKNIAVFRCLNCNAMLGVKLDNKPIFPNFCRHCGQKLDWSSEKYD